MPKKYVKKAVKADVLPQIRKALVVECVHCRKINVLEWEDQPIVVPDAEVEVAGEAEVGVG